MARPGLEMLEGRFAPAALQDIAAGAGLVRAASLADEPDRPAGFAMPAAAATMPAMPPDVRDEVFLTLPPAPDPLMGQIGRLPEQSLEFPASGGGDTIRRMDDLSIWPATAPTSEDPEPSDAVFMEPEALPEE